MTILLVDDDEDDRSLFIEATKEVDSTIICHSASDGMEALAYLRDDHNDVPDFIFLDLRMPGLSGEQVCRRIRDELGLRELPVVAYTAHGMPEERERMLASGFDALLIKPISFQDVRQLSDRVAHD